MKIKNLIMILSLILIVGCKDSSAQTEKTTSDSEKELIEKQDVEYPTKPNFENLSKNTNSYTHKLFHHFGKLQYKLSEQDKLILLDYDESKGFQSWIVGVIYEYDNKTYTHIGNISFPQGRWSTATVKEITPWEDSNKKLFKELMNAYILQSESNILNE